MYSRSSKSYKLPFFLFASACMVCFALSVNAVAFLMVFDSKAASAQSPSVASAPVPDQESEPETIAPREEHKTLLVRAKLTIEDQQKQIDQLREHIEQGFVDIRNVEVTDREKAYWLVEPNLALGVASLVGGRLQVQMGPKSHLLYVGQSVEFEFEGKACFLILTESTVGKASFKFGCKPSGDIQVATLKG